MGKLVANCGTNIPVDVMDAWLPDGTLVKVDVERTFSNRKISIRVNRIPNSYGKIRIGAVSLCMSIGQLICDGAGNPNNDVDHIDENPLNNLRNNLRVLPKSNNLQRQKRSGGSSKYKGVCWNKRNLKWHSSLYVGSLNRQVHIGYFDLDSDAAKAYDCFARHYHSTDCHLNFRDICWSLHDVNNAKCNNHVRSKPSTFPAM